MTEETVELLNALVEILDHGGLDSPEVQTFLLRYGVNQEFAKFAPLVQALHQLFARTTMRYLVAIVENGRPLPHPANVEAATGCRVHIGPREDELLVALPRFATEQDRLAIEKKLLDLNLRVIERG